MKNPLPFLLTVALGSYLMTRKSAKSNPVPTNEIPTSIDYDDPELRAALTDNEDQDEDEGDEDESSDD